MLGGENITKVIRVDNLTQTSINLKESTLSDLETICKAAGTTKTKLINSILEYYLYLDQDVIIQNGKNQIKVQEILKKE